MFELGQAASITLAALLVGGQYFSDRYFSALCSANNEICFRRSVKIVEKIAANSAIELCGNVRAKLREKAQDVAARLVKKVKVYRSLRAR